MSERNPRMSYEEIIQLLNAYREKECLWNQAHSDYRDRTKRTQAYNKIAAETNVGSIEEVKRRFKVLRDTYGIEKKKMKNSRMSGAKVYNTKLPWYQVADQFLSKGATNNDDTDIAPANSKVEASSQPSKVEPSSEPNDRVSSPESQEQDSSDPLWPAEDVFVINFATEDQPDATSNDRKRSLESPSGSVPPSPKRATRCSSTQQSHHASASSWAPQENGHSSSHGKLIHSRREKVQSAVAQPIRDEFLYFGLNLAAQLEALPKLRALRLQKKIQIMVSQDRIEYEMSLNRGD